MKKPCTRSLLAGIGILLSTLAQATPQVPDTMEQRLAACAACHGKQGAGNPDNPYIPRLAEKPAGYLYKQMQSFKAQQGQSPAMEYVVRQLSPDYMMKIAAYYAAQRVDYHRQTIPDLGDAALARGRQLVEEGDEAHGVPACTYCHGQTLTGVKPMIPGILNLSFDYVVTQLDLWRTDSRSVESTHCMWVVAKRMRPRDVGAVAAYLAIQPLPDDRDPVELEELPNELPGWCVLGKSEVKP